MEERERMMIEKYLALEMTPAERLEVEQRIQTDPQFKSEVEEYKLAIEALKIAQREELKNRFRQRDKVLDRDNTRTISRGRNLWLLAAAVTGIIIFTWLLYYGFRPPEEEEVFTSQDSIQQDQILPDQTDSTKVAIPDDGPKEILNEEKNTKPAKRDKRQELFAANFDPYMDETMDVAMRGDEEDLTALEKFQMSYADQNHQKAISAYDKMSESLQQNDNLRFMYANSLLSLNRIDEAIKILEEVVLAQKSNYTSESNFYLALGYLKKGNYTEARKYLKLYLAITESKQKEKARRILEDMNK